MGLETQRLLTLAHMYKVFNYSDWCIIILAFNYCVEFSLALIIYIILPQTVQLCQEHKEF